MTAPAYPLVHSPRSFIECPVHGVVVALGDDGRITSTCPRCLLDAAWARVRMRRAELDFPAAFPLKEKPHP